MNKQEASSTPELVRCPFCNAMTPPGAFCANCGRAIGDVDLAASVYPTPTNDPGLHDESAGDDLTDIEPLPAPEKPAEQKANPQPTLEDPDRS